MHARVPGVADALCSLVSASHIPVAEKTYTPETPSDSKSCAFCWGLGNSRLGKVGVYSGHRRRMQTQLEVFRKRNSRDKDHVHRLGTSNGRRNTFACTCTMQSVSACSQSSS